MLHEKPDPKANQSVGRRTAGARITVLVGQIETKLKATGPPLIIGSERDVLSMPGYEETIMQPVMAMTGCGCRH